MRKRKYLANRFSQMNNLQNRATNKILICEEDKGKTKEAALRLPHLLLQEANIFIL